MGELTRLEKVRKQRNQKKIIRRIIAITLISAVVLLIVFIVISARNMAVSSFFDELFASHASGSGYPQELSGSGFKAMGQNKENLVLLSDSDLLVYNHNGAQLCDHKHKMSNPKLLTADGKILLFDRGGKNLSLYSSKNQLASLEFENQILTADLSLGGTLCVATTSSRYMAEVKVYNRDYSKEIFQWFSSENLVNTLSVNQAGDRIAVGCLMSQTGLLQSSIQIFRFDREEPVAQIDFGELVILDLSFESDGNLRVVTETGVSLYTEDGNLLSEYVYPGELLQYAYEDGQMLLVLESPSDNTVIQLVSLDRNCKELGSLQLDNQVISCKIENTELYLLHAGVLYRYDKTFTALGQLDASEVQFFEPVGSDVYYLTQQEIGKTAIVQ